MYRVRLVEVQRGNRTRATGACATAAAIRGKPSKLWDQLFPASTVSQSGQAVPCDTPARIVRMSPAMDSVALENLCLAQ